MTFQFIEHDLGYQTKDWCGLNARLPMVLRVFTSRFPRWPIPDLGVSAESAEELCSELFARFVATIEKDGAVPLVALLCESPDWMDVLAQRGLVRAGIHFMSVTDCLSEVPADRRFVPSGVHYTGHANQAIARCLAPAVERALLGT